MFHNIVPLLLGWEFIKENKKVRKHAFDKEKGNRRKERKYTLGQEKKKKKTVKKKKRKKTLSRPRKKEKTFFYS